MKLSLLLCLHFLFIHSAIIGQQCKCEEEFQFLKSYMEQNHPGLNAKGMNTSSYKKATQALATEIRLNNPGNDCILYLQEYFTLLKDNHIYINPAVPLYKRYNVSSQASLDSLYQSKAFKATEKRKVDSVALVHQLVKKTDKDIEGWYMDSQGNLIAFVKSPNEKWAFKGIIVSSKTKLFPPGTVKYQLRPRPNGRLWAMVTFPDHQKLYTTISLAADDFSYIGLSRINPERQADVSDEQTSHFEFSSLDSQTNYLRISSFDKTLTRTLDSFYRAIDRIIQSKPFLIIDIRNNGGGSDASFFGLLNHLYTKPMHGDIAEIWVSPENIKRYEEALAAKKANINVYGKKAIEYDEAFIRRLKAARPFTFIPLVEGTPDSITAKEIQKNPAKIALLMNKGCASSAEMFIYYARQSGKVITMGESSKGMMGFGNIVNTRTPCYQYTFGATTTKYKNFSKYEYVGMAPDIKLFADQDWIKEAMKILNKE